MTPELIELIQTELYISGGGINRGGKIPEGKLAGYLLVQGQKLLVGKGRITFGLDG